MRLIDFSGGKIVNGDVFKRKNNNIVNQLGGQNVMRNIRGNEISMIFQEAMTSLNPVFTIGMQISETIIKHQIRQRMKHWQLL